MNTAIAITAIIAAMVVVNVITYAIRDIAQAKHKPATCKNCTDGDSEEAS